jgi:enoyl-CoA hydratase/carnithine racemase
MKQTLRGDRADRVAAVLERELSEQAWLWDTKDSAAGIAANLQRERPTFTAE